MNFPIGDGQKSAFVLNEVDDQHQPVPAAPTDVISIVSDSPDSCSVVLDPTPVAGVASGFLVGGTPKVGVNITATVKHADGTQLGPITDTVDIVAGPATSLSLTLSAPVAQTPAGSTA